jgi:hypothetical protein
MIKYIDAIITKFAMLCSWLAVNAANGTVLITDDFLHFISKNIGSAANAPTHINTGIGTRSCKAANERQNSKS